MARALKKQSAGHKARRAGDDVTAYALDVVAGDIIAGPHVRAACRRHLNDLETGADRGLWFDVDAARDFFDFCAQLCTVLVQGETVPFILSPAQRFKYGSVFGWKRADGWRRFRTAFIEEGKGNGKALALDTPIPTPSGWTTMGELKAGDELFDDEGRICRVTEAHPVSDDRECYRLTFDSGEDIVASSEHIWRTEMRRASSEKGRALRGVPKVAWGQWRRGLRTTSEIAETLRYANGKYRSANHSVELAGPLQGVELDLPLDPYVLGFWLGDGDSDTGRVTIGAEDELASVAELARCGFGVSKSKRGDRYRVEGLSSILRSMGLLGGKAVPPAYLRASPDQRAALLQGLMDTDGYIAKSGQAQFTQKRRNIAEAVFELAASLGLKPTMTSKVATIDGRDCGLVHLVQFDPREDQPCFRIPRKLARQATRHERRRLSADRKIVDCELVAPVPVRCITVDSPSSMFLAGRHMVPTHNSPGAAAVGLYGLVADREEKAEIYAAATKKDQAMILFRDAVSMRNGSDLLRAALSPSGGNPVWQLTHLRTASFFKPIANDDGQSGPRPHFALVDEVHEVKDKYTIEMLKAGFKARVQPLLFMITNSGSDRNSVAFEYHSLGIEVVNGDKEDDSFFAYICGLDDGDDPLTDESCWVKANPELGVVIQRDYLRAQVEAAQMLPSYQNTVMRLNFCVWTDADRAWIRRAAWEACEVTEANPTPSGGLGRRRSVKELRIEDFRGDKAFGGLDLSWSQDLTARALTFKDSVAGVEHLYSFLKFWTPADTLRQRSKRDWKDPDHYSRWAEKGFLTPTPGKIVPMEAVGLQLYEDQRDFDLQMVAYDRYRHKDLEEKMAEHGWEPPMIEHPQGFRRYSKIDPDLAAARGWYDERGEVIENPLWMPGSIEAWEQAIIEGRFWTPPNPVLRWNVAGVFPESSKTVEGMIVFSKRKATGRIDGAVACAMSVGAAVARFGPEGSALDDFLANPVMTT